MPPQKVIAVHLPCSTHPLGARTHPVLAPSRVDTQLSHRRLSASTSFDAAFSPCPPEIIDHRPRESRARGTWCALSPVLLQQCADPALISPDLRIVGVEPSIGQGLPINPVLLHALVGRRRIRSGRMRRSRCPEVVLLPTAVVVARSRVPPGQGPTLCPGVICRARGMFAPQRRRPIGTELRSDQKRSRCRCDADIRPPPPIPAHRRQCRDANYIERQQFQLTLTHRQAAHHAGHHSRHGPRCRCAAHRSRLLFSRIHLLRSGLRCVSRKGRSGSRPMPQRAARQQAARDTPQIRACNNTGVTSHRGLRWTPAIARPGRVRTLDNDSAPARPIHTTGNAAECG